MLLQWAMKTRNERVLQTLTEVQTEKEDWDGQELETSEANSETTGDLVQDWEHDSLPDEGRASLQEQSPSPVQTEALEPGPVTSLGHAEILKQRTQNAASRFEKP